MGCDVNCLSAFRDCLDLNGLRDIDLKWHRFTWNNKRKEGFIEERLDRFVANSAWYDLFPYVIVENLVWDGSDMETLRILGV